MLQTLFVIPDWIFHGPLLIGWLLLGLLYVGWQWFRGGTREDLISFLPVYAIVAVVIYAVLPRLEIEGIDPADPLGPMVPIGLAIRGYGLFLLTAIILAVTVTIRRCRLSGLTSDQVIQLSFWMLITGIAGARLFYVIQKSDEFFGNGWSWQTLVNIVDMTKGGLVVYGSLIGGTLGGLIYLKRHRLPLLRTADLIAPGMALGLSIGRLGCLMNGCCFGGVCTADYPGITFPAGSPPYMRQLQEGELLGIKGQFDWESSDGFPLLVESVQPDSLAASLGIQTGDRVRILPVDSDYLRFQKQHADDPQIANLQLYVDSNRQGRLAIRIADIPARSARTQPTQIYSAINAFLLFVVLWFFWTLRPPAGQVFALMLILYAIGRFLMEMVRQDERGILGTDLTISQWVSLAMLLLGFTLMALSSQVGKPGQEPRTDAS